MKHTNLLTALALLASMIYPRASQAAQKQKQQPQELIRVFVFAADQTGFSDPGQSLKNLKDSVGDLKHAFRSESKKEIVVVEDREAADIVVEVIARGYEDAGSTTTLTRGTLAGLSSTTSKNSVLAVRVTLTAGDYSTTLDGTSDAGYPIWLNAAISAVKQIKSWVQDNRDKLLARRTK
jgi:hypothetical protein